jgi:hypothetical protein
MIKQTPYAVPKNLINLAKETTSFDIFRNSINRPGGNFFYDPWIIKSEFENSVWNDILKTLPYPVGEARIIVLKQNDCYSSHCDIDDRWHLNITSKLAYLINLDTKEMFESNTDGIWYDMDAGFRHTAVNFGNRPRIQLVVRKLLHRSQRRDLVNITIRSHLNDLDDARYEFDNSISSFLNKINKKKSINNFVYNEKFVSMDIGPEYLKELVEIAGSNFRVHINDQ